MNPYNSTFIHSFILLLIQNWTYTFEIYTVLHCKIDIIGLYGKIIKVSFYRLESRNFRLCGQVYINSDLLLSEFGPFCFKIISFSVRQTSHLRVPVLYSLQSLNISHLMTGTSPLSFTDQI